MSTTGDLLMLLSVAAESQEAQVLRLLVELGGHVVGATEGSLLVYDERTKDLAFAMTVGGSSFLVGQRVPLSHGLTGLAAATREVQIGAPTFKVRQDPTSHAEEGPEAVIAAPMLVGDELVGVLTAVSFERAKRFTARDGELYGKLAAIAGVVVEQRRKLQSISGSYAGSPVERQIAASLKRIARAGPLALSRTARILSEVADFVAPYEHET